MTTLTRWDPFRGLGSLQEQMNRLFDEAFGRARGLDDSLTPWAPPVDIYETESHLVLQADLPDIREQDLDIRIENNMLTIRGERSFEEKVSKENYLRVERAYGSFSRSFTLPNTINLEGIKAEYRNGVLTVHLPKREESKPRQIKVAVGSNSK